jgi:hypothetical protein
MSIKEIRLRTKKISQTKKRKKRRQDLGGTRNVQYVLSAWEREGGQGIGGTVRLSEEGQRSVKGGSITYFIVPFWGYLQ